MPKYPQCKGISNKSKRMSCINSARKKNTRNDVNDRPWDYTKDDKRHPNDVSSESPWDY